MESTQPRRKPTPKAPRQRLPVLSPDLRVRSATEVALGFDATQAYAEAQRCIQCPDPKCVEGCPLNIDIKRFILRLAEGNPAAAIDVISEKSPFPGVCGRVCQHELFCEAACVVGKKFEPVAIGSLERFCADHARLAPLETSPGYAKTPTGPKVALVGSGPASLIAAYDLVRLNYRVTVFEALHQLGGVLSYGIPNFRLPREILFEEIARLQNLGVEFVTDFIVGRTATVEDLFEEGFKAIFIGTGAGLPFMLGIPGENLIGVYTANEFLTRINLMEAYRFPDAATPVRVGKRTVVIGGGNSAMDAARWARRFGAETTVLFRRGRAEMRARLEEIEHAEEEGVQFHFLAAPVALHGDDNGYVTEIECIQMELGPPDSSGRPAPVPIPGSEFRIPAETVVAAIGQAPNPTLQKATPQLLTKSGKIVVDQKGETSMSMVFAGGDVVRGGSTVILAMRDGRRAAEAIHNALGGQEPEPEIKDVNCILARRHLGPDVTLFEVRAPHIEKHWKPGQFIILRPLSTSERIPLTLVAGDRQRGSVTIVVQAIGKTTRELAALEPGQVIADLVGPLGEPAAICSGQKVLCMAGGVGVAELLPVARAYREKGNHVTVICGARTNAHRIFDEELRACADVLEWATDDGSYGFHGNVVQLLLKMAGPGVFAEGHVIGPIPMMKAAAEATRQWGLQLHASLNPIMIDGTGMCGGCRVTVGGKVRFACVDGPEFDAHQVDFDELDRRNRAYRPMERETLERHVCQIGLSS